MKSFKLLVLILLGSFIISVTVSEAAAPVINSLTPNTAAPLAKITVTGTDLPNGKVWFYSGATQVNWGPFWPENEGKSGWFQIPANLAAKTYTVKISNNDRTLESNAVQLTVTGGSATPTPTPTATPTQSTTPTPTLSRTPTPTPKPSSPISSTIACTDDSQITTSLAKTLKMNPGEIQNFSVTITNLGNTKWYDGNFYKLNNLSATNILSPSYGHLPSVVNPNQEVSWNFKIIAPKNPGTYALKLQMVHVAGGQYIKSNNAKCSAPANDIPFGAVLESNITVTAPSPSPSEIISPTTIPSPGKFSEFLSDNWLWIFIGLILLIGIVLVAWFLLKNRSSLPPSIPPVSPSSGETPFPPSY